MYLFVVETLFVVGFPDKNQQMGTTTHISIKQLKHVAERETETHKDPVLKFA